MHTLSHQVECRDEYGIAEDHQDKVAISHVGKLAGSSTKSNDGPNGMVKQDQPLKKHQDEHNQIVETSSVSARILLTILRSMGEGAYVVVEVVVILTPGQVHRDH